RSKMHASDWAALGARSERLKQFYENRLSPAGQATRNDTWPGGHTVQGPYLGQESVRCKATHLAGRYGRAGPSSARIRCSVGGCVLNSDIRPESDSGLMMNMCAVAGLASSGTTCDAASSFLSALARPSGPPAIAAPPASASNSRDREIAAWINIAAIGARMSVASSAIGFWP